MLASLLKLEVFSIFLHTHCVLFELITIESDSHADLYGSGLEVQTIVIYIES